MSEDYENLGPVVNPDGTPTDVTKAMFTAHYEELNMDTVCAMFSALAIQYGKQIQFQQTIGVGDWGDTHSLFVIMTDDNNAYQWTIRHRDGNHWAIEFDALDELRQFVDLELTVLAGAD
jgi:hypothetical protein